MSKLIESDIQRQNILNNHFAVKRIQTYIGFPGMLYQGEYRFTKKMVAEFYEVEERTIERYLENFAKELKYNGYVLIRGKSLQEFKLEFAPVINVGTKTTILGLFNFRSFLNLGMLLKESEKAQHLRSKILDIVIQTVNEKTGGGTKYINRRDADYLPVAIRESKYRKEFTLALNECVEMGNYKYAYYTDIIYLYIFRENAKEYKQILKMKEKENARDTMYAEILNLIASFETGLAYEMRKKSMELERRLTPFETDELFKNFAQHPLQKPHIEDARIKMSSRDLHFRDAIHRKLEEYIHSVSPQDFERFLGEQSVEFEKQLQNAKDVLKRLKENK
ncbi:MAG: DNA-binding protein [Candidatus Celaenobacter antarcticus]|nr:DNA-binding protein [Candidatus Celaenobacter antarcticus]